MIERDEIPGMIVFSLVLLGIIYTAVAIDTITGITLLGMLLMIIGNTVGIYSNGKK